jgi:hypothetical protein
VADKTLDQLNAIGGSVGDGFTDLLLYGDPDAGATIDRDLQITPYELFVQRTRAYSWFWDDFYTVGVVSQQTGGSGSTNQSNSGTAAHPGCIECHTNAGTTDSAGVYNFNAYAFVNSGGSNGRIKFLAYLKTPSAVSDGTNRYSINCGLTRTALSYAPTDCIMWRYVDNVNGGRWQLTCRSGGAESTSDAGGSAVVANTWYRLEIDINSGSTSVTGYVDGTAATGGAISTNIPLSDFFFGMCIVKSLGTSDRAIVADGMGWLQNMSSAR